jgi:hypothetical protein
VDWQNNVNYSFFFEKNIFLVAYLIYL